MNLELLDNGARICPDDPGEPLTGKPRISVTEQEGQFLSVLATDKVVLEIGTGLGVSTKYLSDTARHVVTVDTDPWVQDNVWPKLARNVIPVSDRSQVVNRRLDMVFIDGHHTFEDTFDDVTFAFEHIAVPGFVVVHDALDQERVGRALGHNWYTMPTTYGLAMKSSVW